MCNHGRPSDNVHVRACELVHRKLKNVNVIAARAFRAFEHPYAHFKFVCACDRSATTRTANLVEFECALIAVFVESK